MTSTPDRYPRTIRCGERELVVRPMTSADRAALVAMVATLPPGDLLFLSRDIAHPKVVDAWMRALDAGRLASLAAYDGDAMAGCTTLYTDALGWSRHVGELRVLVAPGWRGGGLGRVLIQECFAQGLALGLRKLVAQMTTDQQGAIAVFEELGFKPEALLAGHVLDRQGGMHDLVILSHDVEAVAARRDLYGLGAASEG